ncbi:hypothetical protein Poli38472_004360 [Pythium oligandrum]|uniref:ABC transmembrane type-1 domain-containing protein n=1 Tax=Pythium oligandrum TaxID=41045 RepID=A0A8K1CAB1_PYTOL|nr:hypothetical protein Poli38472_004360 [Pythium oligandrum]|eukprot:TMW59291.1 hypothetical protein Poli38472_004360 [Pythium oligandrum]
MPRRTKLKTQGDADEPGYYAAVSPKEERALQDTETIETESNGSDASDGKSVSFSQLFTYADSTDYALMAIGTLSALAAGTGRPIQVLFFGDALNAFNPSVDHPVTPEELRAQVNEVARNFTIAASRQAKRIQQAYVRGILTKEMGWFDVNNPMELPTRAAEATLNFQAGIGRKIGDALFSFSLAVTGMTISFTKGWKLTLSVLAFVPFIVAGSIVYIKLLAKATQAIIKSYGKAGAVAQEALSNVRTVHMFNSI